MPDMLVNLLKLPKYEALCEKLASEGVEVFRALAPDRWRVVNWVKEQSGPAAASECEVSFARMPISCFIAVRGSSIVGYACYDATAPNFFGPTRVLDEEQGKGIGHALLLRCLWAQREAGYVYAIIGGVGPEAFYEKTVGARVIDDSTPGIYKDFLGRREREGQ